MTAGTAAVVAVNIPHVFSAVVLLGAQSTAVALMLFSAVVLLGAQSTAVALMLLKRRVCERVQSFMWYVITIVLCPQAKRQKFHRKRQKSRPPYREKIDFPNAAVARQVIYNQRGRRPPGYI
jgi:hypothetical protein